MMSQSFHGTIVPKLEVHTISKEVTCKISLILNFYKNHVYIADLGLKSKTSY
jgi:hypothetical protein